MFTSCVPSGPTRRSTSARPLVSVLLAAGLVLGACGGDDPVPDAGDTEPTAATDHR